MNKLCENEHTIYDSPAYRKSPNGKWVCCL